MTHVAHPFAQRLGIIRDWKSRWFAKTPKEFRTNLQVDTTVRAFLKKRLRGFYVTSVEIERSQRALRILIKTSRPGMVIGRGGEEAQNSSKRLSRRFAQSALRMFLR